MQEHFTVRTANEALPEVRRLYGRVQSRRREAAEAERALRAAGEAGPAEFARLKRRLNAAAAGFYAAVEELEGTGAVVKDLDGGLLDFPAKRFGDEVWLCWKDGEDGVKFWHEAGAGFGGRRPVEVSDESLV